MLLQSEQEHDDLVELEPTTGKCVRHSKRQNPALASCRIDGHFARLDGHFVSLYRQSGVLHFRIDDTDFELADDTYAEISRGEKRNVLRLLRNNVPLFAWEYAAPVIDDIDKLQMSIDPRIEEEHFDFGLLVKNVLSDPRRRHRIYHPEPGD